MAAYRSVSDEPELKPRSPSRTSATAATTAERSSFVGRSVFRVAVVPLALFAPTASLVADDERVYGVVEGRVLVADADDPDPDSGAGRVGV